MDLDYTHILSVIIGSITTLGLAVVTYLFQGKDTVHKREAAFREELNGEREALKKELQVERELFREDLQSEKESNQQVQKEMQDRIGVLEQEIHEMKLEKYELIKKLISAENRRCEECKYANKDN